MMRPDHRIARTLLLALLLLAFVTFADDAVPPEPVPDAAVAAPATSIQPEIPVEPAPSAVFDGESLRYNFGWSGLNAAEAVIRSEVVRYRGTWCYHIVNEIRSQPVLDWIWKVRDRIEVYTEAATLKPLHYEFIQREGRFEHDTVIDFDHVEKVARAERRYKGKVKKTTVRFDELYDPMTALFVLRSAELSVGDRREIDAFDGKRVHTIEYRVVGEEAVKTRFGEKKALVVHPRILASDPPYKKKETDKSTEVRTVTIWMDDDDRSTIFRIESDVSVGEIYAELIER